MNTLEELQEKSKEHLIMMVRNLQGVLQSGRIGDDFFIVKTRDISCTVGITIPKKFASQKLILVGKYYKVYMEEIK